MQPESHIESMLVEVMQGCWEPCLGKVRSVTADALPTPVHFVQDAVEALESIWPTLLLEAERAGLKKGARPVGKK